MINKIKKKGPACIKTEKNYTHLINKHVHTAYKH